MNIKQTREWENASDKIRDGIHEMERVREELEQELKEAADTINGLEVQIEVLREKGP